MYNCTPCSKILDKNLIKRTYSELCITDMKIIKKRITFKIPSFPVLNVTFLSDVNETQANEGQSITSLNYDFQNN